MLTPRELQVLQLICEGRSTKQIATDLGITFKTAVTHRTSIMTKAEVHDPISLFRWALAKGLVAIENEPVVPDNKPVIALTEPAAKENVVDSSNMQKMKDTAARMRAQAVEIKAQAAQITEQCRTICEKIAGQRDALARQKCRSASVRIEAAGK